ncbi:RNA-binding protein [Oscillatoriales cyanobacterium LEGE 11467]|uniref:RNA-binding protein n=1 Tax=Zarconia navalis LEGE 11467 TaxID=1828826 RepID=A0A928VYA5_9CYAN|nr:R3H domain-containing nucleic acid-binding protein [Zarconia navalis]MBE9042514.1 RNA-binding protein [Zarconia navalis LEGE 11467]
MTSDTKLQRGQQWLEKLMKLSGLPSKVDARGNGDGYWLTIDASELTPEQISTTIGANGRVLDSIQYLANSILNIGKSDEEQAAYTVELNGYRLERQEELRERARQIAEQVRSSGEEREIASLSSAERRQMHTFLKEDGDLETFSQGQEPNRHLVVRLRG